MAAWWLRGGVVRSRRHQPRSEAVAASGSTRRPLLGWPSSSWKQATRRPVTRGELRARCWFSLMAASGEMGMGGSGPRGLAPGWARPWPMEVYCLGSSRCVAGCPRCSKSLTVFGLDPGGI